MALMFLKILEVKTLSIFQQNDIFLFMIASCCCVVKNKFFSSALR